jgi:hypothetical protein
MAEQHIIEIDCESWMAKEMGARATDLAGYLRRCLERYLCLVDYERERLRFTPDEATLICEALRDAEQDSPLRWSIANAVADAIRERHLDQKWRIDAWQLVNRLRGMNMGQVVALIDAVDRFCQRPSEEVQENLVRVGLLRGRS